MDRGDTVVYDFENERASIEYSKGPCSVKSSQWNVPRDTVISIWITPKTDLKSADLDLNKKYKKVADEHRPQISHYIDDQVGIEYNVDEASGIVGLIKYLPSALDKKLRCRARANNGIKRGGKSKSAIASPTINPSTLNPRFIAPSSFRRNSQVSWEGHP